MAAMFLQPWPLLFHLTLISFLLPSSSFSQSDFPRNIETFFPNDILVPVSPPPQPNLSPPSKSSSNRAEIIRAVLITAASTVIVAAAFFFFLQKCVIARRRRDRVAAENALRPPLPPPETALAREGFTRFGGNVKGLILDESGLDVLYWRKLQRGKSDILRQEVVGRYDEDDGGGGEDKNKTVSEIPLLRGKSSTSHNVIHHEIRQNYRNTTRPLPPPPPLKIKSFSFKTHLSSDSESQPPPSTTQIIETSAAPPPLIPARQGSEAQASHLPVRQGSVTQASHFPARQGSVAQASHFPARQGSEAQASHFPARQGSVTQASPPPLIPARQGSVAQASNLPARQGSVTQASHIPARQGSVAQAPPPPPLPPVSVKKVPSPPPPPPPKITAAVASSSSKPPPAPPKGQSAEEGSTNGQIRLKPLHWDKVNPNSDHSMVWDKIDRGSFSFDGDLMEALFGYVATAGKKSAEPDGDKKQNSGIPSKIFILDPKKSQNTAIMIKSLGITHEELIDAFKDGHDFMPDTIERLTRIAPTKEEESKIVNFNEDPRTLADAESFLFHLLKAIPLAFTRLNALLFKANYYPEIAHYKKCLQTLNEACKELRARGLFVKLLEAILKAGNRMNAGTTRGNAQAFNLNALLKLSDVKSIDGKTTLLHFVVEEVIRSEGKRCVMNKRNSFNPNNGGSETEKSDTLEYLRLGLPIVGGLSSEFINVKKSAEIDYETVIATCSAIKARVKDTRRVLITQYEESKEEDEFMKKMNIFLDSVEEEMKLAKDEQIKVMEFVKRTTEYYQTEAFKGKNPFQIFVIIRDFLGMVDKVCVEIARNLQRKKNGNSDSTLLRNAVKFPILPPNFMSEKSRSHYSGGSHSDQ